jgi:hypothetical protein
MSSLDGKHRTLSRFVPEVQRKDMVHVANGVVCPVRALHGSPDYHTNNGVFLAAVGEVVYASCPGCTFSKAQAEKRKEALVDMVEGTQTFSHPWVIYTEQAYTRLARMASTLKTHPATKKRKAEA